MSIKFLRKILICITCAFFASISCMDGVRAMTQAEFKEAIAPLGFSEIEKKETKKIIEEDETRYYGLLVYKEGTKDEIRYKLPLMFDNYEDYYKWCYNSDFKPSGFRETIKSVESACMSFEITEIIATAEKSLAECVQKQDFYCKGKDNCDAEICLPRSDYNDLMGVRSNGSWVNLVKRKLNEERKEKGKNKKFDVPKDIEYKHVCWEKPVNHDFSEQGLQRNIDRCSDIFNWAQVNVADAQGLIKALLGTRNVSCDVKIRTEGADDYLSCVMYGTDKKIFEKKDYKYFDFKFDDLSEKSHRVRSISFEEQLRTIVVAKNLKLFSSLEEKVKKISKFDKKQCNALNDIADTYFGRNYRIKTPKGSRTQDKYCHCVNCYEGSYGDIENPYQIDKKTFYNLQTVLPVEAEFMFCNYITQKMEFPPICDRKSGKGPNSNECLLQKSYMNDCKYLGTRSFAKCSTKENCKRGIFNLEQLEGEDGVLFAVVDSTGRKQNVMFLLDDINEVNDDRAQAGLAEFKCLLGGGLGSDKETGTCRGLLEEECIDMNKSLQGRASMRWDEGTKLCVMDGVASNYKWDKAWDGLKQAGEFAVLAALTVMSGGVAGAFVISMTVVATAGFAAKLTMDVKTDNATGNFISRAYDCIKCEEESEYGFCTEYGENTPGCASVLYDEYFNGDLAKESDEINEQLKLAIDNLAQQLFLARSKEDVKEDLNDFLAQDPNAKEALRELFAENLVEKLTQKNLDEKSAEQSESELMMEFAQATEDFGLAMANIKNLAKSMKNISASAKSITGIKNLVVQTWDDFFKSAGVFKSPFPPTKIGDIKKLQFYSKWGKEVYSILRDDGEFDIVDYFVKKAKAASGGYSYMTQHKTSFNKIKGELEAGFNLLFRD